MEYYGYLLLKFFIGFTIVITHMNLSGKTQLSQMTPVDFIGNFVLGGIIGGVIYSDTIPMLQYIAVLIIGVCLIGLLNAITKHISFIRSLAMGDPIPIIKNGEFIMENIRRKRNKIDIINVSSRLHAKGINSFQEIAYAQIEPSGDITVICKGNIMPSLILMKDGNPIPSALHEIAKDNDWIFKRLKSAHIDPDDVFIIEYFEEKMHVIFNDGKVKTVK
ncbi:DUF421 domain-containing protein [Paenochrobactrum pullorum]|uniref:DUF421 domain-containing protein n=1 Tax=Paenochrobactrum pullorum TaxID=1324351 RepID=UPI0035BC6C10